MATKNMSSTSRKQRRGSMLVAAAIIVVPIQPIHADEAINNEKIEENADLTKSPPTDWPTAIQYFDAYDQSSPEFVQATVADQEFYLFSAGDVHLRRVEKVKPSDKLNEAHAAISAFNRYLDWYSTLSDETLAALPLVRSDKRGAGLPTTRGRVRVVVALLITSHLTGKEPQRVTEEVKDIDASYFGVDALKQWLASLRYNFDGEVSDSMDDVKAVVYNLEQKKISPEAVLAFINKVRDARASRNKVKSPLENDRWLRLADNLQAALSLPPKDAPPVQVEKPVSGT